MKSTVDNLIADAMRLPLIPLEERDFYRQNISRLTQYVNDFMLNQPDIMTLIGENDPHIMFDNHGNHASFMATVFSTGSYTLFVRTVVWVYHMYHAHSFSFDYFPRAMNAWLDAIESLSPESNMTCIKSVYKWIVENHKYIVKLSEASPDTEIAMDPKYTDIEEKFLKHFSKGIIRFVPELPENQYGAVKIFYRFSYMLSSRPCMRSAHFGKPEKYALQKNILHRQLSV